MNQKGQQYLKQILAGAALLFVAFMVHWVFIHQNTVFATKHEVHELKKDICVDLEEIKSDVKFLIRQKKKMDHYYYP